MAKRPPSLFITTGHMLVDIVEKSKKITLKKVAEELGVSKEVVEDWATDIQLETGLIELKIIKNTKYLIYIL